MKIATQNTRVMLSLSSKQASLIYERGSIRDGEDLDETHDHHNQRRYNQDRSDIDRYFPEQTMMWHRELWTHILQ